MKKKDLKKLIIFYFVYLLLSFIVLFPYFMKVPLADIDSMKYGIGAFYYLSLFSTAIWPTTDQSINIALALLLALVEVTVFIFMTRQWSKPFRYSAFVVLFGINFYRNITVMN